MVIAHFWTGRPSPQWQMNLETLLASPSLEFGKANCCGVPPPAANAPSCMMRSSETPEIFALKTGRWFDGRNIPLGFEVPNSWSTKTYQNNMFIIMTHFMNRHDVYSHDVLKNQGSPIPIFREREIRAGSQTPAVPSKIETPRKSSGRLVPLTIQGWTVGRGWHGGHGGHLCSEMMKKT